MKNINMKNVKEYVRKVNIYIYKKNYKEKKYKSSKYIEICKYIYIYIYI